MKELPDKKYLRPDEVAEHFGVSRRTVYSWIEVGKIKAVKIAGTTVRIPSTCLLEIIKSKIE